MCDMRLEFFSDLRVQKIKKARNLQALILERIEMISELEETLMPENIFYEEFKPQKNSNHSNKNISRLSLEETLQQLILLTEDLKKLDGYIFHLEQCIRHDNESRTAQQQNLFTLIDVPPIDFNSKTCDNTLKIL